MKYAMARQGRAFVARLEQGDVLNECVEQLAAKEQIQCGVVFFIGGLDDGSRLVVGPRDGYAAAIEPMQHVLAGQHEACGVGTLFPNEAGRPVLHMHASCGRNDRGLTGCTRAGANVWLVGELVIWELLDCPAGRVRDEKSGFELLQVPWYPSSSRRIETNGPDQEERSVE